MTKPLLFIFSFLTPVILSAQGYFYTEGTVQINAGASIEIKGHTVIHQSIDGDGFMVMNGDNPQTMGGSSSNMNNLKVTNSSNITLNDPLWVNDSLFMESGTIFLEDEHLYLADNSVHTGNTMGFVQTNGTGYVQRKLDSTPFTFHFGSGNEYFPVTLTELGTADTFRLQAWDLLPDDGTSAGTALTSHIALLSFSAMDIVTGGNNLSITMQWNDTKNAIDFVQPYAVGIWHNGSNYVELDNCPTNVNTIDPNIVSYVGVLNIGTFGIGDSIYLSNIPTAFITPGDTTVCEGNSVTFTALPAGAAGYLWSNSANTSSINTVVADTYFVDITDSTGCVFRSSDVELTTLPLPTTPTIIQTGNDLSIGGGYTSYQWYLDGNPISGANTSTYTVTGNGNYSVVVYGANGCTNTSTNYNFNTFGIEEDEWNNINITTLGQQIYISMVPDGECTVSIYDALGKVVHQGPHTNQYISLVAEAGIYVVVLQNGQQQFVKKVILR